MRGGGLITGLVLAGGASRRMGRDKALVEVAGRPMVRIVADALDEVCDRVLVCGRSEPVAGLAAVADPPGPPYRGPLAGLAAGLEEAGTGMVAAVAVDQPWVRPQTLRRLLELADELAVLPLEGGVRQTTCAVFPASLAETAAEELAASGSIQSLLDRAAFDPVVEEQWRGWGEDGRSWFSADTPEAIEVGLQRFGPPG